MSQPENRDDNDPARNFILTALPDEEYRKLRDRLEPIECHVRQLIYDRDKPIRHVYFPTTAVLSMVSQMDGEAAVEVAPSAGKAWPGCRSSSASPPARTPSTHRFLASRCG